MSKVQIVVATMKQQDISLYKKMNAKCDLIIANQADFTDYNKTEIEGNLVELVSTETKGVGLNRNIGLQYIRDDIILLADDDIVYTDNYCEIIENAFNELCDADVIVFEMEFYKNGVMFEKDSFKTKRLHLNNGLSFGTYQIAIRNKSFKKANLHFSTLFGGGCLYSCGEDSKFLIDCYRSGLKVYSYHEKIGNNYRESSSWFVGYTKKFFYDRGIFAALAFPKTCHLICAYYLFVYRKSGDLRIVEKWKLMNAGIKNYDNLLTYEEWSNE